MSRTPSLLVACVAVVAASSSCGGGDATPDAVPVTICTDGFDNDGDGSTDYPADPGCDGILDTDESNAPIAMCTDGRDNDADGLTDYPDDPGCFSPLQNDEADTCPTGPTCPACANQADDDSDSATDYPQDTGCSAASDDDEWETNPAACGPGLLVTRLMTHDVNGVLPASPSNLSSTDCGGTGGEVAYEIVIEQPSVLVATTDNPMTVADTVLYLRSTCTTPETEMTCNDDLSPDVPASSISVSLAPGVYYLVVDAASSASAGMFHLHVDLFAGDGVECANQAECGPGLQCRIPLGETVQVCTSPVCSDTVDDDGDGKNDFPDDPGCASPADFDEADSCPNGDDCPACGNGVDDDVDDLVDFPADTDCSSASQPVEGCGIETDPLFSLTSGTANGDLTTLHDDFNVACTSPTGGLDQVYFVVLPKMKQVVLDTIGSTTDTVLAVYPSTCTGTELGCDDDSGGSGTSQVTINNLPAGAYAVVVENYSPSFPPGPYNLHISGTIAPNGVCDGALAASGAISCGPNHACIGGVCTGNLACNNNVDDDGDGDIDYPEDPGCGSTTDTDEVDDCPAGPNCPACANGMDDDGDGQTDYPADVDCDAAGGLVEQCGAEQDPLVLLTTPTNSSTTVGLSNDFKGTCDFSSGAAPDEVSIVTLPSLNSIHVDMLGSAFDAVLMLKTASCGTADLACNDAFSAGGDVINYAPAGGIAAGVYAIVVDGYSTNQGAYNLNVTGKIALNGRCDGALANAGALTCDVGLACKGPVGNKQCLKTECSDGVNNADGDAFIDFPSDPGCSGIGDDSEADTCPSGPGCPVCGNGADDDGDSLVDYPADYGCSAASGTTEVACATETDAITVLANPVTNGTTTGKANNFTPSCNFGSNAPDVTYILQLPVPVANLTIDTITTPFNTVLTFDEPSCTAPTLACDDNGGGSNTSKIVQTNLLPGAYAITVDGASTASGNFALHIDGRAAPNAACTSPLFASGVLSCGVGQHCMAGVCQ
jgi:hypothetical protein